jgi:hypothetical protein
MCTMMDSWERQLIACWEQQPSLLSGHKKLIDESRLFDYLCGLGADWAVGKVIIPHMYFAAGQKETSVSVDAFPRPADSSFEAYQSRVAEKHGSQSTLLYIRNAQPRSPTLYSEVERLLAPVWISGLRWKRLEIELYVGRYEWTAIGIHRETCANIHHVVRGEKEMLVWPPHLLSPHANTPQCAEFGSAAEATSAGILNHASCFRVKAAVGQAIYVPSGHWHVGVSRELSVAINLSLYGIH